jgi:hypothetical protein
MFRVIMQSFPLGVEHVVIDGGRPQLRVFGVRGFDVSINASGDALRQLEPTGGLTGLFHRITVLGDDSSTWTTTPLD